MNGEQQRQAEGKNNNWQFSAASTSFGSTTPRLARERERERESPTKMKMWEKEAKFYGLLEWSRFTARTKNIEDNNSEVIEGFIYAPRFGVYRYYWNFCGSLMKSRELYAILCICYVRMTMCENRMNEKLNDSGLSKLRIVKFQLNYLVVLFFRIFVEVIKILKHFFLFKMKEIDISRLMKFLHIDCSTQCVCYRLIA